MIRKLLITIKLRKLLKHCNFEFAKSLIVKKFSGTVIPKELGQLLDNFISNPCINTAMDLIKHDSSFLAVFELARKDGFSTFLFEKGDLK